MIDVAIVLAIVLVVSSILVVMFHTPDRAADREKLQIDRANKIIMKMSVIDDIETILPANIKREITQYVDTYLNTGELTR